MEAMRTLATLAALALAFTGNAVARATPLQPAGLPAGWAVGNTGPSGGTVWVGRIPDRFAPWDHRTSAVYLPPNYSPSQRYPVVYLLHGMSGAPVGFYSSKGLRIATVADQLISSGQAKPFIAVMPVAGPVQNPDLGEWAGIWESYVVQDVVPWVDSHLSTIATPQGRALEGLCAGAFGAMDIGLRHPGLFGTLGGWEGYYAPVFRDGPFVHASAADLAAHSPQILVRREVAQLRRDGVRFYVAVGGDHGKVLRRYSLEFGQELGALGLRHELWQATGYARTHFLRSTLPGALAYAAAGFASA